MNLSESQRLLLCWGKINKLEPSQYHPALYHMLDVGNVARVMLSERVSSRWARILAEAFACRADELSNWVPWAVAMHDIGKISAPFQAQSDIQAERMRGLGFRLVSMDLHHTQIGQAYLRFEVPGEGALQDKLKKVLVEMIGGHHGLFSPAGSAKDAWKRLQRDEESEWQGLRNAGVEVLKSTFLAKGSIDLPEQFNISSALIALTGFTILCDWIGSNSLYFSPEPTLPLSTYTDLSYQRAVDGVGEAGFMQPFLSPESSSFASLFRNITNPRPLQNAVDSIPERILAKPCLIVIEAPTGEGKTEAALALAHRIASLQGSDEFYYALPTTATSNQMYERVRNYLKDQLGLSTQARLVHSQAFLFKDAVRIEPTLNGENDREAGDSLEWFSSKKKALLAPFGVGTVDQVELGALNVAHNALRLVGLAGKVLVLDEVHAYDTYMTTILCRLLNWLSALGTSVILLSATLPRSRREKLARAYGAVLPDDGGQLERYPLIFASNPAEAYWDSPAAAQPERVLEVSPLHLEDDMPEAKATWLVDKVGARGCWCWITNTVQRAQDLFEAVEQIAPADMERILIHARFPLFQREILEEQLKQRFGPQGKRPRRAIVIGTQVLEQSLDLDFDGMVSDLAPVDLLLQRAGRLHRHPWRSVEVRGANRVPHLYIYEHYTADGKLNLSSDRAIYAEYFLRCTKQVLMGRERLRLPAAFRELVSAVYDADAPSEKDELYKAWQELQEAEILDGQQAKLRLLPAPDAESSFVMGLGVSFKEDEDRAGWIVARTRLGDESITVIPLERGDKHTFCAGMDTAIAMDREASDEIQCALMRSSLKLSGDELCNAVRRAATPLPALFRRSRLLQNAFPLWLENGIAGLQGYQRMIYLELDDRLGLRIRRQKGKE
jgi:CRISPR-associated endonuclease/helicase Cas3